MEHVKGFIVNVSTTTVEIEGGVKQRRVKLEFPTPIRELAMLPDAAIAIAEDIIRFSNLIKREREG